MHIEVFDKNTFTIYIYEKKKYKNINEIKENPEKFFKKIFLILKNKYKMNFEGLYKIEVYPCLIYGMIIEVKKEIDDFYEQYIDGVDLKIKIHDESIMLYEIKDIFITKEINNINLFKHKNKYYILANEELTNKQLFKILEHSKIIYGEKCNQIINPYNLITFE